MDSPAPKRVFHHEHDKSPFGSDRFGRSAERVARCFGTPQYILGQTLLVIMWIALNAVAFSFRWDPYPFILLNLAFSTQAAYAAPLILLAQTRQADRDKHAEQADCLHREAIASEHKALIVANTELTQQVHHLVTELALERGVGPDADR